MIKKHPLHFGWGGCSGLKGWMNDEQQNAVVKIFDAEG